MHVCGCMLPQPLQLGFDRRKWSRIVDLNGPHALLSFNDIASATVILSNIDFDCCCFRYFNQPTFPGMLRSRLDLPQVNLWV